MHESFTHYLDRMVSTRARCECRAFAQLALSDNHFKKSNGLFGCLERILAWTDDKAEQEQYIDDCARMWTRWRASERRSHIDDVINRLHADMQQV